MTMKPGPLGNPFHTYENPLGVEALSGFDGVLDGVLVTRVGSSSSRLRSRRSFASDAPTASSASSSSGSRWRLRMIAVGVIAHSIADGVAPGAIDAIEIVVAIAVAGLPIAAGIAILRYRLYEIDRIINRTLVYGVADRAPRRPLLRHRDRAPAGLQRPHPRQRPRHRRLDARRRCALPARPRRIQAFVDRRFYRRRYDAQQTLEAFSARLRDEIDLETLAAELALGRAGDDAAVPYLALDSRRQAVTPP